MNYLNLVKIAYRSLSKNKLRAFLTMLGIIIGVGAVIALLAIGQGTRQSIQGQISSLGSNVIMVMPEATSQGGVRQTTMNAATLSQADADALRPGCPAVRYATPVASRGVQALAEGKNWQTTVYGAYPPYFDIRALTVAQGTRFTLRDERTAAKVCLLGATVAKELFGAGVSPVGKSIRLGSLPFRVIGVLTEKGQSGFGQNQDDLVLAPFSTVQKRLLASTHVQQIYLSAQAEDQIEAACLQITRLLRQRHRLVASTTDDFTIRTQSEISNTLGTITSTLTALLACIAGISLVVGGIGIMNIMLVSVTERTREIGIRLAIGAKGADVLLQFLIEAVLLSLLGGLLGVLMGVGIAQLAAHVMGWGNIVSGSSIALAFVFSMVIGVFFGWYPARKAARLNPIDALRYE